MRHRTCFEANATGDLKQAPQLEFRSQEPPSCDVRFGKQHTPVWDHRRMKSLRGTRANSADRHPSPVAAVWWPADYRCGDVVYSPNPLWYNYLHLVQFRVCRRWTPWKPACFLSSVHPPRRGKNRFCRAILSLPPRCGEPIVANVGGAEQRAAHRSTPMGGMLANKPY